MNDSFGQCSQNLSCRGLRWDKTINLNLEKFLIKESPGTWSSPPACTHKFMIGPFLLQSQGSSQQKRCSKRADDFAPLSGKCHKEGTQAQMRVLSNSAIHFSLLWPLAMALSLLGHNKESLQSLQDFFDGTMQQYGSESERESLEVVLVF